MGPKTMTQRKTYQEQDLGKSSEWPLGEIEGEPSEKPLGEQCGDASGDRLAEPALQVAEEPMETRGEGASPTREVRGEKGWREVFRKMSTKHQEIIDDNRLKRNLTEHFGEQSGQQFGGTQSQDIPETTQTSFRKSRSKGRVGK